MAKRRDYSRYELKQGSRIVYKGITNDLERREAEHKAEGKRFSHIKGEEILAITKRINKEVKNEVCRIN